jgi:basic membrane lipoprotein Med (substrate-binding protein (PBP1-ABC) superfamily)
MHLRRKKMHKRTLFLSFIAVLLLVSIAVFAGGEPEEEEKMEAAPAAEEEKMDVPTKLHFPMVYLDVMESPWNNSMEQALKVIKAEKPHGLTITNETIENAGFVDIERILREFAASGKYEVIWAHSTYADAVERLNPQFPDILWVITGGGNRYVADNVYWLDMFYHEATYLMGIIAGMMTETNVLGAVGGFPYPNVNLTIN